MTDHNEIRSAVEQYQTGNLQQSADICLRILSTHPNHPEAMHLLEKICDHMSNIDSVIELIRNIILVIPDNAAVYNTLGNALTEKGQIDEAITQYEKALQLDPGISEAHYNLGVLLGNKGQIDEAITQYEKALQLDPGISEAHYNLGVLLGNKGQIDEAITQYEKALQLDPHLAAAQYNLGSVLDKSGKSDEAILHYERALQLNPQYAKAYNNLGNILRRKGLLDEAILHYQKSLQIDPLSPETYNDLGIALKDKGLFDEALLHYQKALQVDPQYACAYSNLGNALKYKGLFDEALFYYQKALQINPLAPEFHCNMAFALLQSGDLNRGWKEYEWRSECKDPTSIRRNFPQPRWDGRTLKGKRLIIVAEQGVGDEIMFASCLKEVIARTGLCIVECDKRLVPLFTRSFPTIQTIDRITADDQLPSDAPPADFKIAIGSLPKFLRPGFLSFPQQNSYLVPDLQKVELWRRRFSELGSGMKIGISWRGGKKRSVQLTRSIVLEQWSELFSLPGIYWINLQYGDCSAELREAKEKTGITIHDWEDADPLKDLDNFAAQIAALDLIISVDNATVHMAGALGVPVWALLPFACDWRWMRDVEDTPWYKTVRLVRRKNLGNWEEVFSRVAQDIRHYLSTGSMPETGHSYKSLLQYEESVDPIISLMSRPSSDRKYRCAVITPVGPGHEDLYRQCLSSIEESFQEQKGSFSEIIPIKIEDPEGKLGRSRARNLGIQKAAEQNIDWIFFLDADDLMAPSAFEHVSPYLKEYDGIWGSIWSIEKGETIAKERQHQLPFLYRIEDVLSGDAAVTLQMGHFVKTSVALATPFNELLDTGEDFDYYLRVWEKYPCIKIPLPFFHNRRGLHSQGIRSATGIEWRQAVEGIMNAYRFRKG